MPATQLDKVQILRQFLIFPRELKTIDKNEAITSSEILLIFLLLTSGEIS